MASLRKKYQAQLASPERDDGPPVTTPPVTSTKFPESVADTKPPEPIEAKSAADQAAEDSLRKRLAEMERAESLQRQQQQPPQHAEPQAPPQQPEMPAHIQKWLEAHPQYLSNDPIAQAEINLATMKCVRDGLTWNDDNFIPTIERHLGLRQAQGNGHAESKPPPQQANVAPALRSAPPREPVRAPPRQEYSAPVSAPPTREVPSMSTGRSPHYRAPLTRDELEIAVTCGQTPEQYQAQKERMMRMKTAGEIQG